MAGYNTHVPADWRSGVILTLPKKGNLSDCNNWRGIALLSIPGKVFCSVLLQRLKTEVDNILREEQAGFRKGRSSSEQIFTLRNIIEQCLELQTTLIINYIDFKKAFDSVHHESLWQIVQLYGVPSKYVNIFRALYRNSTCRVRTSSGTTDDFDIEKKTGWTRTPTAKRTTSECGNGLGARGRQEEEREAKEDVETYV
ncbi:hypothetical protein AAFF_G00251870 [Aldrovandia affinis]|uniref:Reverse transcriptase domain-containing protein n=1 Tax=Aldrovandia affinis TaxID=143900 RepID=A0AAD7WTD5_9TELE|nr:hypothetical protein AAFF_G00251870 [Aldrovandia affinis]